MKKVLLYSGGMDSWLIDKIWKPDIKLYININGDYSKEEIKRLPKDVKIINFSYLGTTEYENKFVPLRNLYFLMIASNYGDEICLGATAGDWGNKDKTPYFLDEAEHMLKYLWEDKKCKKDISINKEFIYKSKAELIDDYIELGGDINTIKDQTFSCYTPKDNSECYECYPCFRKFALLYAKGCEYPKEIKEKMWNYIEKYIIPTKEEGGYQGTYYTDRGEESKYLIEAVDKLKKEVNNEQI